MRRYILYLGLVVLLVTCVALMSGQPSLASAPTLERWPDEDPGPPFTIGVSANHVRRLLNLDSIYAKLLLMLSGVLVHNVLRVVVDQADGFIYLLWSSVLPGAVYTAALTWLFFALKEGLITYKKLRAIF